MELFTQVNGSETNRLKVKSEASKSRKLSYVLLFGQIDEKHIAVVVGHAVIKLI